MDYFIFSVRLITPALYGLAGAAGLLCAALCGWEIRRGRLRPGQGAALVLLSIYGMLVLSATVLGRQEAAHYRYGMEPFWSYKAIRAGRRTLLDEVLLNVLMFLPVGALLPAGFRRLGWKGTVGISLGFSTAIELIQLFARRGFFELDDMIHNTLGALMGCGLFFLIRALTKAGRKHEK